MNTNTVSKDSVLMSAILVAALTFVLVFATSSQIETVSAQSYTASTAHAHSRAV